MHNGNTMKEIESPSRRDFSRRKFLEKLVRTGLAVLAACTILGSSEANAEDLPPGIANCRDRTIRILYSDQIGEDSGRSTFLHLHNRLNGIVGGGFFDSLVVQHKSKRIEPALYLLREQINYKYSDNRITVVKLPEIKDVPQILEFDRGIKQFYISYVYRWADPYITHEKSIGSEQTKRATESHFVHSIAYAAYDDEETAKAKAKEYLDSDMDGKTRVVMDMKEQFQRMGNGDRNSEDPRNPYNRKLAASWASYFLERSIFLEQNRTDSDRNLSINKHIEIPLRETVGFKVGGPPHLKP